MYRREAGKEEDERERGQFWGSEFSDFTQNKTEKTFSLNPRSDIHMDRREVRKEGVREGKWDDRDESKKEKERDKNGGERE
jgi:hypothetical protein